MRDSGLTDYLILNIARACECHQFRTSSSSIEFRLKATYVYKYEAQEATLYLNMVSLGARRMDVRTIVTASSWAEGHQTLSVVGINAGELRTGLGSRPTKVVGRIRSSIVLGLYLAGCRNLRPTLATTSQPDCHACGAGSGLVKAIQVVPMQRGRACHPERAYRLVEIITIRVIKNEGGAN